jgi:THO complex subunit 7
MAIRTLGKEGDKDVISSTSVPASPSQVSTPLPVEVGEGVIEQPSMISTLSINTATTPEAGREEGEEVLASAISASVEEGAIEDNDVEMGEVEEDKPSSAGGGGSVKSSKRPPREDLEEGEASDSSSALTELPED